MEEKPVTRVYADDIRKRIDRRSFLKADVLGGLAGVVSGYAAHRGVSYVCDSVEGITADAEREVRRLGVYINNFIGTLDTKLAEETKKLEKEYSDGKLKIYEKMGIATPAEIEEFERIVKLQEGFTEHYKFSEKAKELKDRLDERLLTYDEKLESHQPGFLQKTNDMIRRALGKKSGEEGKKERANIKERLQALGRVYDTNRDVKAASSEVLGQVNSYLKESKDMTQEEKNLLEFIREKANDQGIGQEKLKDFIKNYDKYDGRNEALLSLRKSIVDAEKVYANVRENAKYVISLQGMLQEGIALKEDIRKRSSGEFQGLKKQYEEQIQRLRTSVDTTIKELEDKGYNIETTEKLIGKGTGSFLDPLRITVPVIVGTAVGTGVYSIAKGRSKRNSEKDVSRKLESEQHRAVDALGRLKDEHRKLERAYGEQDELISRLSKNKDGESIKYESGLDNVVTECHPGTGETISTDCIGVQNES